MKGRLPFTSWHKALASERGAAMVIALLTIMVMVLLTAALVVASMTETFNAQTAEDSARAFLVADAAAAHAIASLRLMPDWTGYNKKLNRDGEEEDCDPGFLYDAIRHQCMGPDPVPYPERGGWTVTLREGGGGNEPACTAVAVSGTGDTPALLPDAQRIGTYTVQVLPEEEAGDRARGKIRLRAVGRVGRAVRGFELTVERVTPADFVSYSSLRVDASSGGDGTFAIHGSVYFRGDWKFHGASTQINDRPKSRTDMQDPVYDNQTFICGNLVPIGSIEIGQDPEERDGFGPMLSVHIAGTIKPTGKAYQIHALAKDPYVPDIQLADVSRAVKCIRGMDDGSVSPPIDSTKCQQEFPGLWRSYTNVIAGASGSTKMKLYVWRGDSWNEEWRTNLGQPEKRSQPDDWAISWRIPKSGPGDGNDNDINCRNADTLLEGMRYCAAYYDAGERRLYVAKGQVIYVPGKIHILRSVIYQVDDNPGTPRENDASMFVVACERGTDCDPSQEPDRGSGQEEKRTGLYFSEMFLAKDQASRGPLYPGTTFPTHDLLAFLVNGKVQLGLSGRRENQEVNAVVVSGCDLKNLPPERCDLTMQMKLQLYGSVISRQLVFNQNVDLYQVPDLRRYLPDVLSRFLSAGRPGLVVTQWREIGF